MKSRRAPLFFRALAYTAYASLVWSALTFFGSAFFPTQVLLGKIGTAAVLANALTFVSSAYCRKRSSFGLEEYLFSALCRTGVLLICTLGGVAYLPQGARRAFATLVLIGYFATAPLHVWVSLPSEESPCKQ